MECLQELESTFDYEKELQKQGAVVAVKLREIKAPQSTLRLESRAEVVAEGRGNTAGRTIEEASDWLEVEKLVRGFAAMGRKQIRVSWTTTYSAPPPNTVEGGSDDEDDVLSGEEEHPTATGIRCTTQQASPPAKKTRRTATVVEMEKAKLAQAKEKNWIPELMERWRCTLPRCHLFGKGACLILPGESQCRTMNAAILGQWNDLIRRCEARVGCFPVDKMKIPPI